VQWGDTYLQNGPAPLSFVDADTGQTVKVSVTADTDGPLVRSAGIQIRRNTSSKRH